jgi:hypothetical protein
MSLSDYLVECREADLAFADEINQAAITHSQRKGAALESFLGIGPEAHAEASAPENQPAWFTGNDPTGVEQ